MALRHVRIKRKKHIIWIPALGACLLPLQLLEVLCLAHGHLSSVDDG